jgi:hypothetical protein
MKLGPGRMAAVLVVAFTVAMTLVVSGTASAVTPLTVAGALAAQNGQSATVVGYVVGQPTSTTTVLRSGFTGDTAIALADSAAETGTSRMLYVQVTAEFRTAFGLLGNPGLLGRSVTVTGVLTAYFSHGGLKTPTAARDHQDPEQDLVRRGLERAEGDRSGPEQQQQRHPALQRGVDQQDAQRW